MLPNLMISFLLLVTIPRVTPIKGKFSPNWQSITYLPYTIKALKIEVFQLELEPLKIF
jgi:hypothetical protein